MKIVMRFIICLLVPFFTLISCGGEEEKLVEKKVTLEDTIQAKIKPEISTETINNIIASIPSPLEMATMLKNNKQGYDANLLNSPNNIVKYNTNYKIAFNIGVYSADLGYINIYEKTFSAMNYLKNIKKLADDIHIGQFFDFETLKRLATNTKNYDSLLFISTDNFNRMDAHLRMQNRNELSVLMICGAWLEGVNIACQVAKTNPNKDLTERLGFEKINLDNILAIVNAYKQDSYFAQIAKELERLKQIYSKIEISYQYIEPETKEVNGQLVIVNKSKSSVNITEQQLQEIISEISRVRELMVN